MPFAMHTDIGIVVGVAKANEVLMFGKKMTAQELLDCGFVKCVLYLIFSRDDTHA